MIIQVELGTMKDTTTEPKQLTHTQHHLNPQDAYFNMELTKSFVIKLTWNLPNLL